MVLTLGLQNAAMKEAWPDSYRVSWSGNVIRWRVPLCPSPISTTYTIEIKYGLEMLQPAVAVVTPALRWRGKDPPPHMYDQERLCLFLPWANEWASSMFIARTTVPWTALWLYFYEKWLATGDWLGGGEHPRSRE